MNETNLNSNKVFEGLAHLQTFDVEMTRVEEVVHPLGGVVIRLGGWVNGWYGSPIRVAYLRLGKLIVMMREEEVDSSRVDVHVVT